MKFTYKYQALEDGRPVWREKQFPTQKALFAYLVANKGTIITQKMAVRKNADACVFPVTADLPAEVKADKAFKVTYSNDKEKGTLQRTILANTYWWLDTLSDVHIGSKGRNVTLFSESIKGRTDKIYPIDQHKYDLDGIIGRTLELFEAPISWRALGVGKTGMTEGIFAVAEISKELNERRYNDYLNDRIDQHSVGMQYLSIELAVNDQEEYPKEFKVWQKYINDIGNRSKAEGQGYFFAILEAKLFEYSSVIAGANELTPTMGVGSGEKSDNVEPVHKSKLSSAWKEAARMGAE